MTYGDFHLSVGGRVFEGIRQQVDNHLVEVGKVNPYRQMFILMDKPELDFLGLSLIFKHIADVIHKTDKVGFAHFQLHHTLLDLPQVHNLTDEVNNTLGITLNSHVCTIALRVVVLFQQRHQRSHDERHRGAYLVTDVHEELDLSLVHFLGVYVFLQFQSVLFLALAVLHIQINSVHHQGYV